MHSLNCFCFARVKLQSSIQSRVKELRETAATDDVEGMKKGIESLQQEVMKMGQAMYGQGG